MTIESLRSVPRRHLRGILLLAGALFPILAAPGRAAAQCAPADAECQAGQPPIVWIEPGDSAWSGTMPTSAAVPVTVHWCGAYSGLNQGSATILLDGNPITPFTGTA